MKQFILLGLLIVTYQFGFTQGVGINSTGAKAHSSAILDVSSTTKGVLLPRMTTAQRNAISSPAVGLAVYDTDLKGMYVYNGTNWGFVNSSDTLWIKSGNNMYSGVSGNVGIGVNNPTAKLDVDGTFQLSRNSSNATINLGNGNATPKWEISTESAGLYNYQGTLIFKSKEGNLWNDPLVEQLRITHDGKVGIGANPNYPLDVKGVANATSMRVKDASNGARILLESKNSGEAYFYIGNENSSLQRAHSHLSLYGNNVPLRFSTNNGSGMAMYINTSNRIGIGTTTATAGQLNVEKSGAGEQNVLAIGNSNGSVNSEANILFYQNQSSQALAKMGAYVTANSPYDTDLRFSTVKGGNWTEDALVISSDGNVGIGTTSPNASAALELKSTTKGFLPPRMTTAQINAISNPAVGLTVFNTDSMCYYTRAASKWFSYGCCTPFAVSPASASAVRQEGGATITFATGSEPSYTVKSNPAGVDTTVSGSPVTVSGLTNGTAYTFDVYSTTVCSNSSTITTNSVTPCAPIAKTPLSITASIYEGDSAIIKWKPGGNETTFYITGTDYSDTLTATDTVITLTNRVLGKTHTYTIKSETGCGQSGTITSNGIRPWYIFTDTNNKKIHVSTALEQKNYPIYVNGSAHGFYVRANSFTDGEKNTDTLTGYFNAGLWAVDYCKNLTLHGKSDWYLPAAYELQDLYLKKSDIKDLSNSWYWSSTSHHVWSQGRFWSVSMVNGAYNAQLLRYYQLVRCIREE